MIRWSYVIPRLVMLAAICLIIGFGLNPAVHYTLVFWGQSVTSAKVEIGNVDASLLGTRLCLRDLRIADPRRPMKNLVQAEEVSLDLEANALLRQRFIVQEGKISGLRIDTERTTSGKLDSAGYLDWNLSAGNLPELSLEWLDQLAGVLQGRMEEEIGQLESVQLVNELIQRWPAEYERLEERIDSLKARIDRMRELFGAGTGDLLQNINAYRDAVAELDAVQQELVALRTQIDGLPRRAFQDRDVVVAAGQRDALYIRQRIETFSVDADSLSQYLLGRELHDRVTTLTDWIGWARRNLAATDDSIEPARGRGLDMVFAGARRYPDFLVRRLAIDGEAEIGRKNFQFQGMVSGLTHQPKVHGKPAVVQIALTGPATVRMEVVVDRTGDTPHDQFVINCPNLTIPGRQIGREEQFALTVSPGSMHVWMSVDLRGDELSGRFLLKQDSVELHPQISAQSAAGHLAADLEAVLGKVQSLELAADLNGTLDDPRWQFQSNLGPQLAEGLNWAVRRQLESRRDQLAQLATARIEEELARLDQLIHAGQEAAIAKLELGGNDLRQLSQTVTQRFPVGKNVLGKHIPIDLGLRF
jgi:uncharacterized protein (TIGR03545 family)